MSRHTIQAKNPNHEVVVGWDPPLNTYFATVYDNDLIKRGKNNPVIEWIGAAPGDVITEIEDLLARLAEYADISYEMQLVLYGEAND